jgi:3-methyladenine DNA glycosylase AlkD
MGKQSTYLMPLQDQMYAAASRDMAKPMEKYMKNLFPYLGVKAPLRKTIYKAFIQNNLPTAIAWEEEVRYLWSLPEREFQYTAIELCWACRKMWNERTIDFFIELIKDKSWWDSVDAIASILVGHYFTVYPQKIDKYIISWSKDEHLWVRRTSIIFQLKYGAKTDWELLQRCIHNNLNSKEFFINKAIGWALRQYAKTNPSEVKELVLHTNLSNLSKREALKHIG